MKHFNKPNIILFLIVFIAFLLRFYNFSSIPEGFHSDEAAFGYNAYSLLQTGKDEYGTPFPLSLKSFGDYKGAIYSYITIPFVYLFGLSEAAVRLPSVLFGTGLVLLTYFIVNILTKNKKLSFITSTLTAISPLGILLSRVQSDPLVSVFFVLLGFYFFLRWFHGGHAVVLYAAGFSWIISYFTYASPRVFVPVLLILLSIFYGKQLFKKGKKLFVPVFIAVFLVAVFLFVGTSGERVSQLNVFGSSSVILPLQEQIREDGPSSALVARVFHNKITAYGTYFLKGYFDYFSFDFLFLRGGFPEREIIPDFGILFLLELPFLLLGLYKIIEGRKRWGIFVMLWLLVIPALLAFAVHESPNVHRFFLASFPLAIIVGYGVLSFYEILRKYKRLSLLFLIIIPLFFFYSLLYFIHQMFIHQPVHMPWYRGFANKQLAQELKELYPKYKQIVITKAHASPYIYLLFYQKYEPKQYQHEGSPRDLDYSGFGKYFFIPHDCPLNGGKTGEDPIVGEEGVLYINKGSCVDSLHNAKLLKTIYWKDNSPAFKLMEYVSTKSADLK